MHIIDDLNTTIENLMIKEFGAAMPFDISFGVPQKDFTPVTSNKPTANFYLYDIRKNKKLYSNEPVIQRRYDGTVAKKLPPERIQLSYCITAWSPAAEDAIGTRTREEHKQLSNVLVALIKHPTIPNDVLSGALVGQEPPLQTSLALPEDMENLAQFWNALDGVLKPFLDYRVTISLDFDDWEEGTTVAAMITSWGDIAPVFVASIHPFLQNDHEKGTAITIAKIEKTPSPVLASPASQNDTMITVGRRNGLNENDFIMIVDGNKTEFTQVTDVRGNRVFIHPPLLFDHAEDTELKKLTHTSGDVATRLATVAGAGATKIRFVAEEARRFKPGMVICMDDPGKVELLRIDQISGPEVGLGNAETFIRFGGIVMNRAPSPVPIVGAKVTLLDSRGIYVTEALSDSEGKYYFQKFGLSRGTYTLKAEAEGYNDAEKAIQEVATARREDFIIQMGTE